MKRIGTVFIAVCLLAANSLSSFAQEVEDQKFEVRLGLSGYPELPAVMNKLGMKFGSNVSMSEPETLDELYREPLGPHYSMGSIGAEFSWHAKKWFDLCAGLYVTPFWAEKIDPFAKKGIGTKTSATFSMLVMARFNYFSRPRVKLYSSIGAGVLSDASTSRLAMNVQLVPFGVSFGGRFFGFAELGLGTLYLGGNIGVGYKF